MPFFSLWCDVPPLIIISGSGETIDHQEWIEKKGRRTRRRQIRIRWYFVKKPIQQCGRRDRVWLYQKVLFEIQTPVGIASTVFPRSYAWVSISRLCVVGPVSKGACTGVILNVEFLRRLERITSTPPCIKNEQRNKKACRASNWVKTILL